MTSAAAQLDLAWRDAYAARTRAATMLEVVREAIRRRGTAREVAAELDQIFGPEGRPVSESVLKAALSPESERNYFRLEWIVVVLDDPAVKAFLSTPIHDARGGAAGDAGVARGGGAGALAEPRSGAGEAGMTSLTRKLDTARRRKLATRPSHIRSTPLVMPNPRAFGETATAVVAALNAGCTLGEAARRAGTAKSTARVIRLRAARRGMLNEAALLLLERGVAIGAGNTTSPNKASPASCTTAAHVASAAQGRHKVGAPAEGQPEVSRRRAPANLLRGTCAICTAYSAGSMQELDGREVFVCARCEEEHPRAGGHDAGGVGRCAADRIGDGNRRRKAASTSAGGRR